MADQMKVAEQRKAHQDALLRLGLVWTAVLSLLGIGLGIAGLR